MTYRNRHRHREAVLLRQWIWKIGKVDDRTLKAITGKNIDATRRKYSHLSIQPATKETAKELSPFKRFLRKTTMTTKKWDVGKFRRDYKIGKEWELTGWTDASEDRKTYHLIFFRHQKEMTHGATSKEKKIVFTKEISRKYMNVVRKEVYVFVQTSLAHYKNNFDLQTEFYETCGCEVDDDTLYPIKKDMYFIFRKCKI